MTFGGIILILIIISSPLFFLIGKLIFKDWATFKEAIWYWFKWDTWSLFDGTFFEDMIAEFKLGFWVLCCAVLVFVEYWMVWKIIQLFK